MAFNLYKLHLWSSPILFLGNWMGLWYKKNKYLDAVRELLGEGPGSSEPLPKGGKRNILIAFWGQFFKEGRRNEDDDEDITFDQNKILKWGMD